MQKIDNNLSMILRRRTTGILLAVVMVALWFFQGWPLRAGFVVLMCMSVWEVYEAFRTRGEKPLRFPGMLFAVLAMPLYMIFGTAVYVPLIAVCTMLALSVMVVRGQIDYSATVASVLPIIYPGVLIALLFPLQDIGAPMITTVAMGQAFLIALMGDLMAYEIGSIFGKRKLAPALSPKKTVEGSIGGMVASVVFAMVIPLCAQLAVKYIPAAAVFSAPLMPYWHYAILGVIGGAAAQIGDLTASMIKRYCGVKDFGTIFPGHGGMLDRMDSVLFSGVVVYIYYLYIALK